MKKYNKFIFFLIFNIFLKKNKIKINSICIIINYKKNYNEIKKQQYQESQNNQ